MRERPLILIRKKLFGLNRSPSSSLRLLISYSSKVKHGLQNNLLYKKNVFPAQTSNFLHTYNLSMTFLYTKSLVMGCLLIAFSCVLGHELIAQASNKPAFVPKHVLIKLKNEVDWKLSDYQPISHNNSLQNGQANFSPLGVKPGFALISLADHYQASISHPFKTRSTEMDRTYLCVLANENQEDAFIREVAQLSYIEYAEKEPMYYVDFVPNDYTASAQYYINKLQGTQAWDLSKGDTNIVIAIVDVAVMTDHVDLKANMFHNWLEVNGQAGVDDDANGFIDDVMGWDAANNDNNAYPPQVANFDHGTHVAGCASAVANNNIGVAGIGYKCKILPVKAKSDASTGSGLDATLGGIDYAIASKYTDVINMSFGGSGAGSLTWQNLLNVAYSKGIVVVAAAGNDNTLSDTYFPCSYDHVICVASSNQNDGKSWFSNYGSTIDVTTPGSAIKSTTVNGVNPAVSGYQSWDGTSMASPVTAGVIGLMLSVNPTLNPDAIESCLKQSCDNINAQNPTFVGKLGAGRVNAFEALKCLTPTAAPVAAFTFNTVDLCGGVVHFTDLSQNLVTSHLWDFGNGQTSTVFYPTAYYTTPGTYTVTLTVGNSIGSTTTSQTLTINSLPIPIVDAGTNIAGCYNQIVNLTGSSSLAGNVIWTPSSGLSNPSSLNTSLTITQPATYTLTVITPDGCKASDTVVVTSGVAPTVYAGADRTINPGDSTQFNAIGSAQNLTYLWSPSNTLNNPTIKNPVAKPAITTLYTLTVTSPNGCANTDEVIVYVTGTVANDIAENFQLKAPYPNPTQEGVHLSANFSANTKLNLVVYDVMGRKVETLFEGYVLDNDFAYFWDMNVQAGVYLVTWEVEGRTFVQKVVKAD